MLLMVFKYFKNIKLICALIALLLCFSVNGQTSRKQQLLDSLRSNPSRSTEHVDWLNRLAYSYWDNEPKKTDSLGRVALELSEKIDYDKGICKSYNRIALGQWMLGNYPLAHENALQQLKIAEKNSLNSEITNAYSTLALIYDDQGLLYESLKYHELVLKIRVKNADSLPIASALNNMASVYFKMDSLDKSLSLFRESYEIRKKQNSKRGIRESLSNIAYILNEQGKPHEAMPLIKESLKIAKELNHKTGIVSLGASLGNVYLNLRELDSAEQVLLRTLPLAKDIGLTKRTIEINDVLYKVYKEKEDFERAYKYLNDYWVLKDSIEGQESTNKILELQTQYETEKKEKEIFKLEQQNLKSEGWRNIFAMGTLAMLLVAAFIYMFYRYRQLKNEKLIIEKDDQAKHLQEVNNMKSQFLANISHEFRTPLTLILGPTKELLSKINDVDAKQQLHWIYQNGQKLLKLINQLLELSKIEAGKLKVKVSQQDLVAFSKQCFNAFESLAVQKDIQLKFKSDKSQVFAYFDAEKIEQVINNLLSNAFKFTNDGIISVQIDETLIDEIGYAKITVTDSGTGIHEQQLPYIFDRFYQAEQGEEKAYEGTGIGLSLCKQLVELHSGKIDVESKLGKGTTFNVYLPLGKFHFKDEDILTIVDHKFKEKDTVVDPNFDTVDNQNDVDKTLPLVLIIDDNKDIVKYIQLQLKGKYHFLTAYDGTSGLEIAQQKLPDLIISDIMMPGLTGLQLCNKIKGDIKTDHIPVVLLTAKVGQDQKIKGLEAKADEYLQKPFNKKELEIKVHNLIENRKRLRKRFANKVVFQPSEIAETTQEELFLQNVKDLIEKHYKDPQFDVMTFCDTIGMSKSQLNRKMKAVFNKSPNQFIRSYRLEYAKQLIIKNKSLSLSEIAYEVGFTSPAYFSKCFHDEFGYAPSDIKK